MAYALRGSRPLTVDNLNYRWRNHDGVVSVWHVLDAGLLRVLAPPDVAWHVPTPAYVARVIRMGIAAGWRTQDHLELALNHDQFAAATAFGAHARLSTRGQADRVDAQLELLGLQPLEGNATQLRVTLLPAGLPTHVFDLDTSNRGRLTLYGVVGEHLRAFDGRCDPTWLEDVIVALQETPDTSSRGPEVGIDLRHPGGTLRWRGSLADPRARVAAHGAWRLARRVLEDDAQVLLERLHPVLELPEEPWVADEAERVVRVFGALRERHVVRLVQVLASGGWVVDARNLGALDDGAQHLLHIERGLGDVWCMPEAGGLRRTWEKTLEGARQRVDPTVRQVLSRRLAAGLDPRWAVRAGEVLTRGGSLDELDRWLASGWVDTHAPDAAIWFDGRRVRRQQPERSPWIAMNRAGVWVALADGRIQTYKSTSEVA